MDEGIRAINDRSVLQDGKTDDVLASIWQRDFAAIGILQPLQDTLLILLQRPIGHGIGRSFVRETGKGRCFGLPLQTVGQFFFGLANVPLDRMAVWPLVALDGPLEISVD